MDVSLLDLKGELMSHIVSATTTIVNPDRALLSQACQIVASNHNGEVSERYRNYNNRPQQTALRLAIVTPEMQRGIGIQLDADLHLGFIGDPFMVEELYEQIQEEVVQTYVSLATMQALQQLGYTAQAEDAGQGQIAIRGTVYA
jgi:hypothetical protein